MSYGPSLSGSYRHLATFVDKILRGAKPADLPTKLELVIKSRTAKSLGLVIPPTLLPVADEVIEKSEYSCIAETGIGTRRKVSALQQLRQLWVVQETRRARRCHARV
jgi:hypothetical protein